MNRTARHWIKTRAPELAPYLAGAAFAAAAFIAYRVVSKRVKAKRPGPMTPATSEVHAAEAPMGNPGTNLDERLDEALQESFPTSDPVSIQIAPAARDQDET
jgi:hypothetical protein